MVGRVGITCPRCSAKLCVDQTLVYLIFWVCVAALLASVLLSLDFSLSHTPRALALEFLPLAALIVLPWFAPYLWGFNPLSEVTDVAFPLETAEPPEDSGSTWRCPACREANPENFEVCWKCQKPQPSGRGI